ncbi:hypothetical protein PIB30_107236 [Stylosanthes scabra]|uniref:Uncharacterized protein n=1 Tax=Stylosanthes scabra TaxID=79078 RepID=A0ABU6WXD3_9FABA|nr:hypothetical protein [Stylosanthes scabra]
MRALPRICVELCSVLLPNSTCNTKTHARGLQCCRQLFLRVTGIRTTASRVTKLPAETASLYWPLDEVHVIPYPCGNGSSRGLLRNAGLGRTAGPYHSGHNLSSGIGGKSIACTWLHAAIEYTGSQYGAHSIPIAAHEAMTCRHGRWSC